MRSILLGPCVLTRAAATLVETYSDGPLRFIGGERARPHPVQAVDFTHQMTLRIVVMVVVIAAALQRQSPVLLELELADHLLERLQAGT